VKKKICPSTLVLNFAKVFRFFHVRTKVALALVYVMSVVLLGCLFVPETMQGEKSVVFLW
jgi:hypothetical protein